MEKEIIRSIDGGCGDNRFVYWTGPYEPNCDKILEVGEWFEVYRHNKLTVAVRVRVSCVDEIVYGKDDDED